jgi:PPOX class probable F420-dependent enzyme
MSITKRTSGSSGASKPDPSELLDPVRQYLSEPRCAVLSTLSPDGAPSQAVVHYLLERDALVVNGRIDRQWTSNLRRDARVSILVHDAERPLHWVGFAGTAKIVSEDSTAVDDAVAIARRYAEDPTPFRSQQRISFRILPHRSYQYGSAE